MNNQKTMFSSPSSGDKLLAYWTKETALKTMTFSSPSSGDKLLAEQQLHDQATAKMEGSRLLLAEISC